MKIIIQLVVLFLLAINCCVNAQNYLFNQGESGIFVVGGIVKASNNYTTINTNAFAGGVSIWGRGSVQVASATSKILDSKQIGVSFIPFKEGLGRGFPSPFSLEISCAYVSQNNRYYAGINSYAFEKKGSVIGVSMYKNVKIVEDGFMLIPSASYFRTLGKNIYEIKATLLLKYVFIETFSDYRKASEGLTIGMIGGVKIPVSQSTKTLPNKEP